MVKRGISGKGRGGAPPLPRQRGALRVVQLTLAALAVFGFILAYDSWLESTDLAETAVLTVAAATAAGWALWMGIRTVRGPQPPSLD
ncbi:MAG: hypothetical protein ACT4OM_05430 [Actinomycetota bacterium]